MIPTLRGRLLRAASIVALSTASAAPPLPALAHGDHGGGGGIVLPAGTTLATVSYDVTQFRPVSDERLTELSAQGQNAHGLRDLAVASLSLAHGLTRDLTVAVRIPYVANHGINETSEDPAEPGVIVRGGVYGFGDISATATYRVLRDARTGLEASLILGFRAPTGRTDAVDRNGERFETEHQPGSGSWDGIFGAALSQEVGRLTFSGSATYTLAGTGAQDTRLGDRIAYGAAVTYRLWQQFGGHDHAMHLGARPDGIMHHGGPKPGGGQAAHEPAPAGDGHVGHAHATSTSGTALDVSLGFNGMWWDRQTIAGVKDDNTGGHILYISPGLRLTVDNWAAFVTVGVPVARELNGIQSEPTLSLSTGVAVRF